MKFFIVTVAIAGAITGPSVALSGSSYGSHTLATYVVMAEFCTQAHVDAQALQEPLTGTLNNLCN